MDFTEHILKVDGFRFINHLHTTARQLKICSQILLELNGTSKLQISLIEALIQWSIRLENSNSRYGESKGRLTNNGKPTTAFSHYLDLCKSLTLVTEFNKVYANSRLSFVLTYFLCYQEQRNDINLNQYEKLFYLHLLLKKDADGIFLVLSILSKQAQTQQELQRGFLVNLNERLLFKQNFSFGIVKQQIGEKFRAINFLWQNPEKYAEHLLIPRCEWLSQLDLIAISKSKNSTSYYLTDKGKLFLKLLPTLPGSSLPDIDDSWMTKRVFTVLASIYARESNDSFQNFNPTYFTELGYSLEIAVKVVISSNLFRIPAFDSMLFVCLNMLTKYQIIINFSDIISLLNPGFSFNDKQYIIKNAGRINESYISTRLL